MQALIYNQEGKETGKIELPKEIFGLPNNTDLIHQVAVSMSANRRAGTAHTKFRGEVRGGGRKPWKQKGTGRARHGSSRSPIWIGGGVTHGPRVERIWKKKINRKMAAKALLTALSGKFRAGEILWLKELSVSGGKTKLMQTVLVNLARALNWPRLVSSKKPQTFIVLPEKNTEILRATRNLLVAESMLVANLNVLDVLNRKYLIFVNPEKILTLLNSKLRRSNKVGVPTKTSGK
ncbi:50S ribosomal protein L4 [Candidatus Nomurabacteria bacterium RIFCSPLOWO2_02_FULL_42_17]|uniref:Large ribosomal subunit protein uL4 n=2 Tax=Candidatus Nomuraibacteriota TaxID=1752729 RepID=A0A1F6WII8_9BACT|nr:MAG: 50S ribosomal protein L4 [Parcubacteria group bacterium GW2011_GWA2_42_18]OGI81708.1 MAG: 50S ribosomal protein L4 [Candidatus Nomurabacteria bacterium RIFCSPHIGHO2_02_FULL_42_24]OGI97326.1 MAG: 50S ribosomal protein L4 [Candidatus Nomurabacteria bacterium RIFCSPLOWO2_02_FULL_42_17]